MAFMIVKRIEIEIMVLSTYAIGVAMALRNSRRLEKSSNYLN